MGSVKEEPVIKQEVDKVDKVDKIDKLKDLIQSTFSDITADI